MVDFDFPAKEILVRKLVATKSPYSFATMIHTQTRVEWNILIFPNLMSSLFLAEIFLFQGDTSVKTMLHNEFCVRFRGGKTVFDSVPLFASRYDYVEINDFVFNMLVPIEFRV